MALPPIVAVEMGTSTIRVLVGEAPEAGHLMITGVGQQPSRGVRKGEIVHFDNALTCVRSALDEAERQSRVSIQEVNVILSGGDIQSRVNRGSAPVMGPDKEIGEEDVDRALETAKALNLPSEREVLHTIHQHFLVDDQTGIVEPMGMEGAMLGVDMLIVHGVRSRLRNTVRIVKSAHVEVHSVAFGGLCSALAVLTPEQKENGVLVIDLGGGTTDYFVYADKAMAAAGSLSVGGDHITNDLALGLRIPMLQAERLKRQQGRAMVDLSLRRQKVSLPAEGGFAGRDVRLVDVHTIIEARMTELLDMVRAQLGGLDFSHQLSAGVVLTGGGARLGGIKDLVTKRFELPCDIGKPRSVSGLSVVTEGSEFAASVGMLRFGLRTQGQRASASLSIGSVLKGLFGK
jgi:cell division protein FtsA